MNRLKREKQEMVLNLLVEGNSVRSIERITGIHRDTIIRLMIRVGKACHEFMERQFIHLNCQNIECDEIWTYIGKKQRKLEEHEKDTDLGDQYVFVALDRDTKLIPAYMIGKRDSLTTYAFLSILRDRVRNTFQLTTDYYQGYKSTVFEVFGPHVHYAALKKLYRGDGTGREGYSPAALRGTERSIIIGKPNRSKICTSYVERQNLTIRTQMKRFTRLTNAFSKTLRSLQAAIDLHFWWYNFQRVHSSVKQTPAQAARISDKPMGWEYVLN